MFRLAPYQFFIIISPGEVVPRLVCCGGSRGHERLSDPPPLRSLCVIVWYYFFFIVSSIKDSAWKRASGPAGGV